MVVEYPATATPKNTKGATAWMRLPPVRSASGRFLWPECYIVCSEDTLSVLSCQQTPDAQNAGSSDRRSVQTRRNQRRKQVALCAWRSPHDHSTVRHEPSIGPAKIDKNGRAFALCHRVGQRQDLNLDSRLARPITPMRCVHPPWSVRGSPVSFRRLCIASHQNEWRIQIRPVAQIFHIHITIRSGQYTTRFGFFYINPRSDSGLSFISLLKMHHFSSGRDTMPPGGAVGCYVACICSASAANGLR